MAGTYANSGERAPDGSIREAWLTELLYPWFGQLDSRRVESYSFSFSGEAELEITMNRDGEPAIVTLSRTAGQFDCKDGALVLMTSVNWFGGASSLGVGLGGDSVELRLHVVEGYLYVARRDTGFLLLPLPMRSTSRNWSRFQQVPSPSAARPPDGGL